MNIPGAKDWELMTDGRRFAAKTPFGSLLKLRSRSKAKALVEALGMFDELDAFERKARRELARWKAA